MMNSAVAIFVTVWACLSTRTLQAVHVQTYDPESLYHHFKQRQQSSSMSNGEAYMAEAEGLAYFTPMSQQLMNNGTVSRDKVLKFYNLLTPHDKTQLYNAERKIRSCWNDARTAAETPTSNYEYCYFGGFNGFCRTKYKYKSLTEGETQLRLISCLAQHTDLTNIFAKTAGKKRSTTNHGLHIERGGGASLGFYISGSHGVAFHLNDISRHSVTQTFCYGIKFDASVGFGFSVSYLFDMNDLLGAASTVEVGIDIPGTEIGIDLLLHFSQSQVDSKLIGFGFAVGMGIGLNPVDVATSFCNTKLLGEYKGSSLIRIGWVRGWSCGREYLGILSEGRYICCPENNPHRNCHTGYCWFDGTKCPHTPQQMFGTKGFEFIITHSSCPGQTYISEGKNRNFCINLFFNDREAHYVYYKDPEECWFGYDLSIDTCVWAPSSSAKYNFYQMFRNNPTHG